MPSQSAAWSPPSEPDHAAAISSLVPPKDEGIWSQVQPIDVCPQSCSLLWSFASSCGHMRYHTPLDGLSHLLRSWEKNAGKDGIWGTKPLAMDLILELACCSLVGSIWSFISEQIGSTSTASKWHCLCSSLSLLLFFLFAWFSNHAFEDMIESSPCSMWLALRQGWPRWHCPKAFNS